MPLTNVEKDEITGGFKAAGERMNGIEKMNQESRDALDELERTTKLFQRAKLTGLTETGETYRRFWPDGAQAKAFGEMFLVAAGKKAAGESVNVEGGYLVSEELSANIIQKLGQYGKFRRDALVVPMGSDRLIVPKVGADLTIYAPGEGNEITDSDMSFGQVGLTTRKLCCLAKVSSELEEDSVIALGEILGISFTRSLAKKEDEIGFLGDGTEAYFAMTGVVGALRGVDATIGNVKGLQVASGNAYSEIALVDFEGCVARLADEADDEAKWFVNRKFYFSVMYALARAAGVANIFEILTDRRERFFMSYPVEFVSAMPSTEANSQICAILGDLQLGAFLGERRAITIARSTDVFFSNDQVAFRGTERIDINAYGVGDTTESGAIVGLITAAS